MRNKVDYRAIIGFAAVAALSLATVAQAQFGGQAPAQKPGAGQPEKPSEVEPSLFPDGVPGLEEIIAAALQENPDIRIAQAKVREADAALNQARMEMIRQAVTLRHALMNQQAEFRATKQQFEDHIISAYSLGISSRAVSQAEAQLLYLMGRTPPGAPQVGAAGEAMRAMMGGGAANAPAMRGGGFIGGGAAGMMGPMGMGGMDGMDGGGGDWLGDGPRPAIPRGKMAEQLRAALDKETRVEFHDVPLTEAIEFLAESTELNIVTGEDLDPEAKVTLTLKKAPLGAVLQALEDRAHVDFIVRDYGILVTGENSGPEDGLPAHEFWQMPPPRSPAK